MKYTYPNLIPIEIRKDNWVRNRYVMSLVIEKIYSYFQYMYNEYPTKKWTQRTNKQQLSQLVLIYLIEKETMK